MCKQLFYLIAMLGATATAFAQQKVYYEHISAPQVFEGSKEKVLAWCGGVNAPQLAMADLNNDGKKDLVIYETGGFKVRTFINKGTSGNPLYRYDPAYIGNFPSVSVFIRMVDYDRDGITDFVTRGISGFNVYKGYFDSQDKLAFNYYRALQYQVPVTPGNPTGWLPVNCLPEDVPDLVDVDGDGDVDAFSFNQLGAVINFYRNCQVDDVLPKDSIRICLKDECWGKTYQNVPREHQLGYACTNENVTCKGCGVEGEERVTHIGGNVLTLFDYDGDGDKDYMTSNVAYPDVQFFKNGKVEYGLTIDSMISQDTIWDGNGKEVSISTWAAPFALDIDQDADTDLLFLSHNTASENYKSIWLFKNGGNHNYDYVSDTFLVEDMIDVGRAAYPVFYDFNKDGKKDILLGSDGVFHAASGKDRAAIAYLENTGTATQPKFTMRTRNLMNIAAANYNGTAIAIGDLDNDGKDDLVLGHVDGTLSYYKNTAASNSVEPVWALWHHAMLDKSGNTIDVLGYAAPCIYDMNKDGKPDLLIGSKFGYVAYYENIGTTPGSFEISPVSQTLGDMKAGPSNSDGYSTPYVGRIDDTNIDYIILGSVNGDLHLYDGFQSGNTSGPFTLLESTYSGIRIGDRSAAAFADLDGDNKYEMVLGNKFGGLHFLDQYFNVGVEDVANNNVGDVRVYPNPATGKVNISWQQDGANAVHIKVVSVTGQLLLQNTALAGSVSATIDISSLQPGMYYCTVSGDNGQVVRPLAVIR